MKTVTVLAGALLISLMSTATQAQPLTLARAGRTAYSILHAPDAPSTVRGAALELQHYLHAVSGALPQTVTEPGEPVISLGDTSLAREAGLSAADIPLEGFRIVTRGPNVFILGPDTADGERTPRGGTNHLVATGSSSPHTPSIAGWCERPQRASTWRGRPRRRSWPPRCGRG